MQKLAPFCFIKGEARCLGSNAPIHNLWRFPNKESVSDFFRLRLYYTISLRKLHCEHVKKTKNLSERIKA